MRKSLSRCKCSVIQSAWIKLFSHIWSGLLNAWAPTVPQCCCQCFSEGYRTLHVALQLVLSSGKESCCPLSQKTLENMLSLSYGQRFGAHGPVKWSGETSHCSCKARPDCPLFRLTSPHRHSPNSTYQIIAWWNSMHSPQTQDSAFSVYAILTIPVWGFSCFPPIFNKA